MSIVKQLYDNFEEYCCVAAVALMAEVSCVILTEGVVPDEALRQRAQQQDINLMGTELSTYDTAAALKQLL